MAKNGSEKVSFDTILLTGTHTSMPHGTPSDRKVQAGDFVLYPKLLAEQFDENGRASITTQFADKTFQIHYDNPNQKDFGKYIIKKATCDSQEIDITDDAFAFITKADLANLSDEVHEIVITLD